MTTKERIELYDRRCLRWAITTLVMGVAGIAFICFALMSIIFLGDRIGAISGILFGIGLFFGARRALVLCFYWDDRSIAEALPHTTTNTTQRKHD